MMNRNGIPVDIKRSKYPRYKVWQNEINRFKTYATMLKVEDGQAVWTMVPVAHPDFKSLKREGFKIIEVWDKKEVST